MVIVLSRQECLKLPLSAANPFHVNRDVCIRWHFAGDHLWFKAVLPNCYFEIRDRTMGKTPEDKCAFACNKALAFHGIDTVIDRLIHLKNDLSIVHRRAVRSVNSSRDVKYTVANAASRVLRAHEYAAEQKRRANCAYVDHVSGLIVASSASASSRLRLRSEN